MKGFIKYEQLKREYTIKYDRPKGLDRLHLFLAMSYVFKTPIFGAYVYPKDECDFYEDAEHFKFLTKYNLTTNALLRY